MSKKIPSSRRGMAPKALSTLVLPALLLAGMASGCALVDGDFRRSGDKPLVGEGGRVVGFSGAYSLRQTDLEETESFSASAAIDQFLTDEHAVGAYVLGQFNNIDSDEDGREQIWSGLRYSYNLHLSKRTSIYGGPTIGVAFFDDDNRNDASLTWGVAAGLRHWLTERVALTVEPTYLRANFDRAGGGNSDEVFVLWGFAFSL